MIFFIDISYKTKRSSRMEMTALFYNYYLLDKLYGYYRFASTHIHYKQTTLIVRIS